MRECRQSPDETIWQHGLHVAEHYARIRDHLDHGASLDGWRIPEWLSDPRIAAGQLDRATMAEYLLYHDCGKPLCRTVDEQGRQHFPDHARISAEAYLAAGGSQEIAHLIRSDMDIHLLKAEQVPEFATRPEALSLLLAGLAEIHSNARMFGGIESTSFKIKWKHLDKAGRRILNQMSQKGQS